MIAQVAIGDVASLGAGLFARARLAPAHTAYLYSSEQGYQPVSGQDMADAVRTLARGFVALGIRHGDRVALMAGNSPDWAMMDFALLAIGAVTVPIYPSYGLKETLFVLEDSRVSLLLVEGAAQLKMVTSLDMWGLPEDRVFVHDAALARQKGLSAWQDIAAQAARTQAEVLAARLDRVGREDLATIVYTSGTSGWPRGVMLSHGNILANIEAWSQRVSFTPMDRVLSFLPLSHVFERTTGHFGCYIMGAEVAYAERPDTVVRDLPRARPTVLISVPRLLQVLYERARRDISGKPGPLGVLLRRGLGIDAQGLSLAPQAGMLRWLARTILGQRLRRRLGGRLRFFVSGGAPLPVEISRFFQGLGLPIVEGYGMSEASPVIAANPVEDICPGSVGPVMGNLKLRFGEDGELQIRGPSVMQGYWNNVPATQEALRDGWLHTGDVGYLNEQGYLVITDRKKDFIVNSGGENISPQKIEMRLMADPLIDQAVVFGDKRPYLTALIYPNMDQLRLLAGAEAGSVQVLLRQAVQRALKDLPLYEQVKKFHVLSAPLSQESGELTPTLKVKRRLLQERFQQILEALYEGGGSGET